MRRVSRYESPKKRRRRYVGAGALAIKARKKLEKLSLLERPTDPIEAVIFDAYAGNLKEQVTEANRKKKAMQERDKKIAKIVLRPRALKVATKGKE